VASRGTLSGLALAYIATGVILAWSGIENQTLTVTLKSLIGGKQPPPGPAEASAGTVAGTITQATGINQTPPSAAGTAALQAYAQVLLAAHGWPAQFSALNSIIDAESSWNPNAENPSGAYGIAQALGHGTAATAGSVTNQYGNFGTSDAICQAANSGSGSAQLEWMCNYIGEKYGTPDQAWAYHLANGSY
jgi:hypothetical protein